MTHQIRASETRSKIVHAAQTCFSRSGFEASSVSDICREAGVTKGAFYYHFASKQALFIELLNTWLDNLDHQLNRIRAESTNVPDSLLEMAESTKTIFDDSSNYLSIFLEFWLYSLRDPQIWQLVIEPYRRYFAFFSRYLSQGMHEGSIHPANPDLAARALLSMAMGIILQGLMDPQATDWNQTARESIRLLLEGLKRDLPDPAQ